MFSGCATTRQVRQDFPSRVKRVKTVVVMPPQVMMYQYQAGGTLEEMDAWNTQVRETIASAVQEYLPQAGPFAVKFVKDDSLRTTYHELWSDTEVLYEAVAASAYAHTLTEYKFPTKVKHFDYTLGSEVAPLAEGLGADAFLFIYGYDYVSTSGRLLMRSLNTLATIAVTALTRVTVLYVPDFTPTFLSMSLVDGKTGDVLWYKIIPTEQHHNFLNTKSLTGTIQWMLEDLQKETGSL